MLINQLRRYHMNASTGAVVKQDDHGADAMMCAVLKWRFDDTFGADIAKAGVLADAIAHHEMENPEDSPLEPVQAQEIEEPGVPDMAVHYRTRRRGLMVAGVNTPTIAVPVGLTRKPSGPAQARIF